MASAKISFDFPAEDENTPLLSSSAPQERYFPRDFYTGESLTSISEEKEREGSGKFHTSLPPTPTTPVSKAFDDYIRAKRASMQMDSLWDRIRYRLRPQTFIFLHLATATMMMTGLMIFLPLFNGGLMIAGSDPYVGSIISAMWIPVMLFLMLAFIKLFLHRSIHIKPPLCLKRLFVIAWGLALSFLLIMYCSPPTRLPVHLQPILTSLVLPISAAARYFIIKQGISGLQISCLLLHMIGTFVAIWPIIFNIGGKASNLHWLHLLFYILGLVPGVFAFVFATKCLSQRRAHTFSVLPWCHLLVVACLIFAFWTNLIPGLGSVSSMEEFVNHVGRGFECFYGQGNASSTCSAIPERSALFLITYTFGLSILMIILRFKEGLLYLSIILGFSSLLTTVFWSLFLDVNMNVNFAPRLDADDSIYLLAGLGVVVVAFVSFIYLGCYSAPTLPVHVPRVRQSSISRNGPLKFAKPEPPSRKKTKRSKSTPNFNIYL